MRLVSRLWPSRLRNVGGVTPRPPPEPALVQLVVFVGVAALLDTGLATCRITFALAPVEVLSLAGRVLTGWTLCGIVVWILVRIATVVRSPSSRSAALVSAVLASAATAAAIRSAHGGLPADGYAAYLWRLALVCGAAAAATAISLRIHGSRQAWMWTTALGLGTMLVVLAPAEDAGVSPGLRSQPLEAAQSEERERQPEPDLGEGTGEFPTAAKPSVRSGSEPQWAVNPATAPDIVLLTIDTWRADTLSQHPHSIAPGTAPTLERWASQGRYYSAAMASVPLTGPSHAAMLAGRSPWSTGHLLNGERVDASVPWAPETLQAAGYCTAAFVGSAMLNGGLGFARGFDVYDDDMDGLVGWRRTVWSSLSPPRRARDQRHERWERRGEKTLERVERWLGRAQPACPLFVWVHLYEPHAPYEPATVPTESLRIDSLPDPVTFVGHPSFGRPERRLSVGMAQLIDRASTEGAAGDGVFEPPSRYRDPPGAEELARRRDELLDQTRSYLDEVRRVDELAGELGRVVDSVRAGRSRTWIVVGDHGESLTEHHEYASHQRHVYQANLAVPLIVLRAADRGAARGSTVGAPVSLAGISGTLLRLAGLDSGDFPELLDSDELAPPDASIDAPGAIVLGPDHGLHPGKRIKAAAWDGRYKLIATAETDSADAWEEWYDTRVDPAEAVLLDPAALPGEVTERLRRATDDVFGAMQLVDERASRDVPKSMREAMRALGYVEP